MLQAPVATSTRHRSPRHSRLGCYRGKLTLQRVCKAIFLKAHFWLSSDVIGHYLLQHRSPEALAQRPCYRWTASFLPAEAERGGAVRGHLPAHMHVPGHVG